MCCLQNQSSLRRCAAFRKAQVGKPDVCEIGLEHCLNGSFAAGQYRVSTDIYGSIAAIRCEADFLLQVHRTQPFRVALQPVV